MVSHFVLSLLKIDNYAQMNTYMHLDLNQSKLRINVNTIVLIRCKLLLQIFASEIWMKITLLQSTFESHVPLA